MHVADVSPVRVPIEDEGHHSRLRLILASLVWSVFHFWHEDSWAALTAVELRGHACQANRYRMDQCIDCWPR